MTELRHFLTSLFDAVSEAETQALLNGRTRLERMVESGRFPDDVSLPVYHANELTVSLDVGLEAKHTKTGIELFVTEPGEGDETALEFDLEVYDFLEATDLHEGGDRRKPPHEAVDVHVPLRDPPAGVDPGVSVNDPEEPMDPKEAHDREREGRAEGGDDRSETGGEETRDHGTENEETGNDETENEETGRSGEESGDERRTPERGRSKRRFVGVDLPEGWPLRRTGGTTEDDEAGRKR
ncbi:hypothetical protein DQW50_14555 [Halorubrum sp. 48-1-W]|uniref:hypothetical protein n=1 Tax=Halorubrum sp. 48-1-W TaxID=2249761 RepID=UPI000DCF036E|nr:hypothetical protein [Halorubrum sp. 48-1-W]RAW44380.1 hypothetical protein DQW50_14555 [Halorubrum sp. 48-1-W]